ncbi:MAG: neutral/alkaline non-lysosomal ceramidase N-terminal domain-containing protein [Planctomycetota bacterium]
MKHEMPSPGNKWAAAARERRDFLRASGALAASTLLAPSLLAPSLLAPSFVISSPLRAALATGTDATWKAGLAKAVITPDEPVWLAGYGSKRAPDGKLHELWMKALAVEDPAGQRVVLVTSDFQGVPKVMSDPVFAQVEKKYGLKRDQLLITFSHNHCGPRLGDDLIDYYPVEAAQEKLVADYTATMITRMVEMIGQALASLAPATLQQNMGQATFAVNRRNNREADVPAMLANGTPLAGPVDHSVPVLTVTRPSGELAAVLFGYACHPTTLSFTTWCGDYPGFAQLQLEKLFPTAQAMFVNTCGGDQNPLPRRSVELCQKYGQQLATAVQEVLRRDAGWKPITGKLKSSFAYVDLPYSNVVTRAELVMFAQDSNAIKARWASRLLRKLATGHQFEAAYPYPIHVWRWGTDFRLIGMGAETVVDYALRFKKQYGPGTWVCGYADDMIAYIPSRRVWEEGGYEGGSNLYEYGRPALRWAGDIEERIAQTVDKLMQS